MQKSTRLLVLLAALAAVTLAYSNHFHNGFHFDDFYSINDNVYIRDLHNLPRIFADATTMSALPANRQWRPLVTASHAIDYAIAGGYDPFVFQTSTFIWFLIQLSLMWLLFGTILERVEPGRASGWAASFATAWYGLHPAMAETVNYVVQRAEIMSACGVVAALTVYAGWPSLRKYGLYLALFAIALLAKATAVVFPLLLMVYVMLFEEAPTPRGFLVATRRAIPALLVAALFVGIVFATMPKSYVSGAIDARAYLFTQPYVAFRYLTTFFLPLHLTVDSDLAPAASVFSLEVFGGIAFLAATVGAIFIAAQRRETRPIAFGLAWFLIALAPTSLFPLAELENGHRLFLPFVGLVLAVTWAGVLLLPRALSRPSRALLVAGLGCLLVANAWGTHLRNEVWASDERLWEDATLKSPRNGRGLMNYGLALMSRGNYAGALRQFERAHELVPAYPTLEINIAIAVAGLRRNLEAEQHFRRALELDPSAAASYFFYARWLRSERRPREAEQLLRTGLTVNHADMASRYLLLEIYAEQGRNDDLQGLVVESLQVAPGDPQVLSYRNTSFTAQRKSFEDYLDESLRRYRAGDFSGSLRAAAEALRLKPDSAEAYNNIAAAHASMQHWDEAIAAARQAIRLQPELSLARNNLAWAESEKAKTIEARK